MSTQKITNRHIKKKLQSNIMQNTGGQPVIERILKAYGFTTRQSLCNHLGISQSTMANRYARNTFPSDWTIICSIETGASLQWLVSGEGVMFEDEVERKALALKHFKITDGVLTSHNDIYYDSSLIPDGLSSPSLVAYESSLYLIDEHEGEINDGWWVIEIDGLYSIREIFRFPGGRIRVENGKASFECQAHDIKVFGKVFLKTEQIS
ncbi:phage repressor protein CI [Klebsiella pneumoniae]|uniref:phage repressor protein CI n=2 Tax=Klebsiella pneumoniae TaxID=573 RepID=UPI0003BF29EA|nr:phage repressor protein CI [Klebsiella pneumoniae]HDS5023916.1 phage repressor protein CI [Klebsiella pneumoniae subsp. ozaenae]EIX9702226.1 phage repressor protein CI [Klebsiella pneumoniae]EKZ9844525.1 phage repressor protein CI [Klebsiella pneumoniae]ELA0047316.1 phage repressor protein CI [Klebsiella pneumoniae]ELA2292141.1 phage repressor protein CI [Klebsiella pneumoniae]